MREGKVSIYTLADSISWNEKMSFCQPSDIYSTAEYYSLFENNGDGKAFCFCYEENKSMALYPFLKNSVNQNNLCQEEKNIFDIQGAYGYNGVICNSYHTEFINYFYKAFDNYCKENNIISEFTRFHPLLENQKFSLNHMQIVFDRDTVVLDLSKSYEYIWNNEYTSKNRNMIRKAEKLGYICEILFNPSKTDIDNFIEIYIANMRAVGAESFYFFNESFFNDTFEVLKEQVYLFNIRNKTGKLLCSAIVFKYNDFTHYHLSGRSKDADNSVNNYLLDQVIRFSIKSGAKQFHLGGGRSTCAEDSLLKFKMSFSKTTKPFFIGKRVHDQEVYDKLVNQWEAKFPEKKEKFRNHLLKYRY